VCVHFFIQSLSSFHTTCPYHLNLFCCSTEIMSSNPSLSQPFTWNSVSSQPVVIIKIISRVAFLHRFQKMLPLLYVCADLTWIIIFILHSVVIWLQYKLGWYDIDHTVLLSQFLWPGMHATCHRVSWHFVIDFKSNVFAEQISILFRMVWKLLTST